MEEEEFKKTGGLAFPVSLPGWGDNGAGGMTLRDWFAGQALAGLVTDCQANIKNHAETFASDAYALAVAMIAERSKP